MDGLDRLEFKRQMFHLVNGAAITVAVYFLKPALGLWILLPLVAALLLMYIVPRMWPDLKVANHLLYHFERHEDRHTFPFKGAILFGVGIIPPIILLDVNYCCAVIIILSVGDSFSTIIGRNFGRIRVGEKSLEGAAAFFLTSTPAAAAFVNPLHAVVLSAAGAVVELFAPLNDNISVPAGLTVVCLIGLVV